MDEKKTEETKLPIEWYIAEDLKSQYATNIVIQHTDQEFLISFFEPPISWTTVFCISQIPLSKSVK